MSTATLQRPLAKLYVTGISCLLGATIGMTLLFKDLNRSGTVGTGTPVGKLEWRVADVRRKSSGTFLWNAVRAGEALYHRDSIRIGKSGSARVSLSKGTVLEIGENSLVTLDDLDDLKLSLKHGDFIIRSEQGDRRIRRESNGMVVEVPLSVRLVNPAPGFHAYISPKARAAVSMQWQVLGREEGDSLRLELSATPDFPAGDVRTFAVQKSKSEMRLELLPGSYYWRIAQKDKILTEMREFHVQALEPLELLAPGHHEKFLNAKEAPVISFQWRRQSVISDETTPRLRHVLEIARDERFETKLGQWELGSLSEGIRQSGFAPGVYFWRVRSELDAISAQTPVLSFEIVEDAPLVLGSPMHSDIRYWKIAPAVTFTWKYEMPKGATPFRFRVEVSSDAGFQVIQHTKELSAYSYTIPGGVLHEGKYHWRVHRMGSEEQIVKTSESAEFTYAVFPELPAPAKAHPEMGAVIEPEVGKTPELSWEAVPGAVRYELSLKNSKRSLMEATETAHFPLKGLNRGTYQWSVRAIDPLGRKGADLPWREFKLNRDSLRAPKRVILEVK